MERRKDCPICLETIPYKKGFVLKCKHKLCFMCASKIMKYDNIKCPMCRSDHSISRMNTRKNLEFNEKVNKITSYVDAFSSSKDTKEQLTNLYNLYCFIDENMLEYNDIAAFKLKNVMKENGYRLSFEMRDVKNDIPENLYYKTLSKVHEVCDKIEKQ